jgi:hypothetical protein
MVRVTRSGGVVAGYVWDYAEGMRMMRYFWASAVALDPAARDQDEGQRFPLCQPDPLADLFGSARLHNVEVRAIEVPTIFRDFDDYWSPFLGGQGPAPGYAMSLSDKHRALLFEHIRAALPVGLDGSIELTARAWAVRGTVAYTLRNAPLDCVAIDAFRRLSSPLSEEAGYGTALLPKLG